MTTQRPETGETQDVDLTQTDIEPMLSCLLNPKATAMHIPGKGVATVDQLADEIRRRFVSLSTSLAAARITMENTSDALNQISIGLSATIQDSQYTSRAAASAFLDTWAATLRTAINAEGADELARVKRAADALQGAVEALTAWDKHFRELEENEEPGDPVARIRHEYHGARIAQTRAALATCRAALESR